jgi:hypothetical protein
VKATLTSKSEDYVPVLTVVQGIRANSDGNQPGDAKKEVELMIDLVKGEECAADKTVPPRLPIG